MINQKIVLAGGSGFIGSALAAYFGDNNEVVILSRQLEKSSSNKNGLETKLPDSVRIVPWDGKHAGAWELELNGTAMVINLSGKSVNCRYTEKNKKAIIESRIQATQAIGQAIKKCSKPPNLWINAASATIYPHTYSPKTEQWNEFDNDFSVDVCKQWEKAVETQRTPFTRKVILRMAITIGSGGIMLPYYNLLKFGLGGRQGSGKQMYSWVHVEDTCRIIEWLYDNKEMEGIFNCSSPNAVTNQAFMEALRKSTGHKFGLPAYEWMLKIGAAMIGTETELVLKSRWVIPERLMSNGFVFKYPQLSEALKEILSHTPKSAYHLF